MINTFFLFLSVFNEACHLFHVGYIRYKRLADVGINVCMQDNMSLEWFNVIKVPRDFKCHFIWVSLITDNTRDNTIQLIRRFNISIKILNITNFKKLLPFVLSLPTTILTFWLCYIGILDHLISAPFRYVCQYVKKEHLTLNMFKSIHAYLSCFGVVWILFTDKHLWLQISKPFLKYLHPLK